MKEEKVWFENSRKNKLCGLLSLEKDRPIIIMTHGMMPRTDKHEYGQFDKIAEVLQKGGFSTFRFDYYGHGETEGDHVDVSIENYIGDLKAAIDFVSSKTGQKIGIFTSSLGGVITILLNDSRPRCIALNCTPVIGYDKIENVFDNANPNWREEFKNNNYFIYKKMELPENRRKIGMKIYNFCKKIDLTKDIRNVHKSLLIIAAGKDEFLDARNSKKLFENANEPKEFVLVKEGNHNLQNKTDELIKIILSFFNKHLK